MPYDRSSLSVTRKAPAVLGDTAPHPIGIRETGPCVNSLHRVWNTCIIEKKLGTDTQTMARDLLDGVPASDKAAWVVVPVEWIARARNVPLW